MARSFAFSSIIRHGAAKRRLSSSLLSLKTGERTAALARRFGQLLPFDMAIAFDVGRSISAMRTEPAWREQSMRESKTATNVRPKTSQRSGATSTSLG